MKPRSLKIETSAASAHYTVQIGSGLLESCGNWARKCLGLKTLRIAIVSNPTVFGLYGEAVEKSLAAAGFAASHFLMKDGEVYKTLRTAEAVLAHLESNALARTDAVIALGGGVVGDLAGFASAVHMRGIPCLQVPTTLLAMIDASVGGKTAVNTASGKNLVGAFHLPAGVLIDTATLRTLPERELTAGLCEAVKQGAVGGRKLLGQTAAFIDDRFAGRDTDVADLIASHVEFKARIVAGDPLESLSRTDARSRKILNFGHTLAHALERVTNYKYFRHGEAVGYGILFAAGLSKSLALCGESDVKSLNDVVHRVGPLPPLARIDQKEVLKAFAFDKKRLSDTLQMVLLKGIGKPLIVNANDIPRSSIPSVLKSLFQELA